MTKQLFFPGDLFSYEDEVSGSTVLIRVRDVTPRILTYSLTREGKITYYLATTTLFPFTLDALEAIQIRSMAPLDY